MDNRFFDGFNKVATPAALGLLARGGLALAARSAGKKGLAAGLTRMGGKALTRMSAVTKRPGLFGKIRQGWDTATAAVPGPNILRKGLNYGGRSAIGATAPGLAYMTAVQPGMARAAKNRQITNRALQRTQGYGR